MKKYFNLPLKKKVAGKKNKVIKIKLKEKNPIYDNICKLSCDHEKLYAQIFHGKPPRIKLLKKSTVENKILIRIIDDTFNSIKYPISIIGNEKNKERNNGIKIRAKGIKN